jgi:hypothetical protein
MKYAMAVVRSAPFEKQVPVCRVNTPGVIRLFRLPSVNIEDFKVAFFPPVSYYSFGNRLMLNLNMNKIISTTK